MKEFIILITIASIAFTITYRIAVLLGKTWGFNDKEQAGVIGFIILGISAFIIYKYDSKGFFLFGTALSLIFFGYKHLLFQNAEKFKTEDDKKYRLIMEQYKKGLSNFEISSILKLPLEFISETIRKSEFEKEIMGYNPPNQSIDKLALKYDLPISYVSERYNWRISGGKKEEKIDPILIFYILVSIFVGYATYNYADELFKNEFLSYMIGVLAFTVLFCLIGFGYFANNFMKNILTWLAFGSFIILIFYQIYLWT
jgi:hypothetical protein